MASPVSIAIKREQAVNAIQMAATLLSKLLAVEPPMIPVHGRDLALLQAQQLEAVAGWLRGAVRAAEASIEPTTEAAELRAEVERLSAELAAANEQIAQLKAADEPVTDAGRKTKRGSSL